MYNIAITYAVLNLALLFGFAYLTFKIVKKKRNLWMIILKLIDGFSSKLIPTNYTFEETKYLKAYFDVLDDGEVSDKERILLSTLATAYGIDEQRVSDLEQGIDIDSFSNIA